MSKFKIFLFLLFVSVGSSLFACGGGGGGDGGDYANNDNPFGAVAGGTKDLQDLGCSVESIDTIPDPGEFQPITKEGFRNYLKKKQHRLEKKMDEANAAKHSSEHTLAAAKAMMFTGGVAIAAIPVLLSAPEAGVGAIAWGAPSAVEPGAASVIEPGVASVIEPGVASTIAPGASSLIEPGAAATSSSMSPLAGDLLGSGYSAATTLASTHSLKQAEQAAVQSALLGKLLPEKSPLSSPLIGSAIDTEIGSLPLGGSNTTSNVDSNVYNSQAYQDANPDTHNDTNMNSYSGYHYGGI